VRVVDGKIVIDQKSLSIDSNEFLNEGESKLVRVHTSDNITGGKSRYGKVRKFDRWTDKETELFYKIIQMCGSDFALIQRLFPTRTRLQIKNKFKREERDNPKRLDYCFKHSLPLDFELFRKRAGVPIELETEEIENLDHRLPYPVVDPGTNTNPDSVEEKNSNNTNPNSSKPDDGNEFLEDDEDDFNRPEYSEQQSINTQEINDLTQDKTMEDKEEKKVVQLDGDEDFEEMKEEEKVEKKVVQLDGDEDFAFSLLT